MLRRALPELSAPLLLVRSPLWVLAVLFFGVGDLSTTTVGVSTVGIEEAGPVTGPLVEQYGLRGMLFLKCLVLGGAYAAWRLLPQPHCVGIPLGLSLVGVVVTVWNARILLLSALGS